MGEETKEPGPFNIDFRKFLEWFNSLDSTFHKKTRDLTTDEMYTTLTWAKIQFWRFLHNEKQPPHIDDLEQSYIRKLRKIGFNYEDIGFALDRSQSSIYEYCLAHKII